MSESKEVPVSVSRSGERISGRAYDSDFARLPEDETMPDVEAGGGPHGTVTTGRTNLPLATMAVGFACLLLASAVPHWLPLAVGVALLLLGAVWAAARNRPLRFNKGVGTVRLPRS